MKKKAKIKLIIIAFSVIVVFTGIVTNVMASGKKIKGFNVNTDVNGITLSWSKVDYAARYYVYRINSNGKSERKASLSVTQTKYTDKDVTSGKTYKYKVSCTLINGSIIESDEKKQMYIKPPKITSVTRKSKSVKISWTKSGTDGYAIYRYATDTKKGKFIYTTTNSKILSFEDKTVKNGKSYKYQVLCGYKNRLSALSNKTNLITF